jgi:hypothetical protein
MINNLKRLEGTGLIIKKNKNKQFDNINNNYKYFLRIIGSQQEQVNGDGG